MQVPNNGFSTSPVQQEEGAAQESLRTLATTDPDNKDFGRVEEIATKAGSAAVTNNNKSVHCIFKLSCKHIGTVQWARL